MSRHQRAARGSDTVSVRHASRIVGWQITAAAAAIVCLVVLLSVAYIVDQSQPQELLSKSAPGERKIYVDADAVLIALVVVGLFAILVAGVFSWIVARRAVRPLGEALRIQRTFVADAGHELRTPLAVLDARIQILQRRLPPGHELESQITEIRADARALTDVVTDLLLAAAADRPEGDTEVVDVGAVLAEAVESMRVLADKRRVRIELDAEPGIVGAVAATSLRRCMVALLDNAVTHSPDGSTVSVTLGGLKRTFEATVTDHGTGVHGIDPARIFERFAHSETSTTAGRPRAGLGIGLALVREIVGRNGGTVELRETSDNGTTIAFTLPRIGRDSPPTAGRPRAAAVREP